MPPDTDGPKLACVSPCPGKALKSESISVTRALSAVSGGLVALGLVAAAAKTGVVFYIFGLIFLPTLAFVGLATFHRVLQSGI